MMRQYTIKEMIPIHEKHRINLALSMDNPMQKKAWDILMEYPPRQPHRVPSVRPCANTASRRHSFGRFSNYWRTSSVISRYPP